MEATGPHAYAVHFFSKNYSKPSHRYLENYERNTICVPSFLSSRMADIKICSLPLEAPETAPSVVNDVVFLLKQW